MNELERFRPLAYAIAKDFFLPGADEDDVRQEAMIGVWKGLRDFREDGGMSLRNFVTLCVRRQLVTALKVAKRAKHGPLTLAVRTAESEDGSALDVVDLVADGKADPVEILSTREEARRLLGIVRDELSPTERRALIGYANGLSYLEIGEADGANFTLRADGRRRSKRADNALQRARRKLSDPLEEAA